MGAIKVNDFAMNKQYAQVLLDPFLMLKVFWPHVKIYDKQAEIIQSVIDNDETVVPAGNKLGKDFISAFIALWFYCSRTPAKVVTSSSGQSQLSSVLWGEIRRFISTSKIPLPIKYNDLFIRQRLPDGKYEPLSYLKGIVTNEAENLQGHHLVQTGGLPRTLWIADEASSIMDEFYDAASTWAHRILIIGNCLPTTNFFFRMSETGTIWRDDADKTKGAFTHVIRIRAQDSPNVRLAEAEISNGKEPSNREVVPGVKGYWEYKKNRRLWDPVKQCIALDAQFWKGKDSLLFPPQWLNECEQFYDDLIRDKIRRKAVSMGVDSAQGNDDTCWTIVDYMGVIKQISIKTHDTSDIPGRTLALMQMYGLSAEDVWFDAGGGGKQHADLLRSQGHMVNSVGFGEKVSHHLDPKANTKQDAVHVDELRYAYKNKRAELYGTLRNRLDPEYNENKFAIPARYTELRKQLALLPLLYDSEGRLYLPPKDKPTESYKGPTLKQMLGRSPDQADSLVLAVYGMINKRKKVKLGVL